MESSEDREEPGGLIAEGYYNTVCTYEGTTRIEGSTTTATPGFHSKGSEQTTPAPAERQIAQELRGSLMEGASISKGRDNMPA